MNPSESVKNYPSERRMYANYVMKNVKNICKNIGPRPSGSAKELEAQEFMAADLRTSCDEVNIEPFTLHPWAFMGWIQVVVVCSVLAAAMLFMTNFEPFENYKYILLGAGVVLELIAVFFVVTEFLLYKETLDVFAPKKTSHNVVAVRRCTGEVKRRIIFSGHADSAPEWRFTYWGGPKLIIPAVAAGLIGVVITAAADIVALVLTVTGTAGDSKVVWILSIVSVCFIPVFLFNLLFYNNKRVVEGANDNLTGCLCAMAAARFLQDKDIRLENTEVWILCTGSEEAGLRGAKAFCKAHGKEFKEDGVETVFFGLDTVRDFDYMAVYHKDMTGIVHNDPQVSKLIKEGAALAGYDLPYKTVSLGSSDAAAVTQAGIKASCFAAMDPAPARYYHTRLDTRDNLDLKTIEAGVDIVLHTLFLYDEKGLDV